MPRFSAALCLGCGGGSRVPPAIPEAKVRSAISPCSSQPSFDAEAETSSTSASSSDTSPQPGPPRKFNLRTAVLAVKASNRLSGHGIFGAATGSSTEDETSGERVAQRRATKRSSLVEQILRRRTQRLSLRRATQTSGMNREEQIHDLMELLKPGMPLGDFTDFAKACGDEAFCGRLLQKYPDNVPKRAEKLRQALVWREQNRVLLTTRKCPQAGDYRVIGADHEQRPVLYMCMRNQLLPLTQCTDFMIVAMLRAIDNMPAGVESATHIWDLHGMMIRLNWNPAPLVAILKAAEGYFAERMHQLLIVDMPRVAAFLKDAVLPLVPEKTRGKVKFLSAADVETFVGQHCPSDVAGRIRDSMAQNRDSSVSLEERKRSWMCVNKHGELTSVFA